MLRLRFEDIDASDIRRLIDEKTAERKTLEYKEKLSIATGDEKVEFLSDISSFANASGGDIIFGISDERDESGRPTGIPANVIALNVENPGSECGRLEQLIETGIQPRIPIVQIKAVQVPEQGTVIVVRVGKSWIAPHMVTYANRSRFYSRNSSTGKVQLDVQQIGAAFALQRSLGERLRAWKANRIAMAISGNGPVSLQGSKLLYHFISTAALTDDAQAQPRIFEPRNWGSAYRLMSLGIQTTRYNADGYLMMSNQTMEKRESYLQIFRDGSLEYGDSYVLYSSSEDQVPSKIFEEAIVQSFSGALLLLKHLEVSEPIFVALTLTGMKGRVMALPCFTTSFTTKSDPFDRDVIFCPDVLIQNLSEGSPYPSTLLPIVNSVWQAAGLHETPYFSPDRRWISQ